MNLRKFANIFKNITKREKTKGFELSKIPRFELFLVIALLVVIITPVVISLYIKISTELRVVNLLVSPRFEELFGKEITENLLYTFNEANPGIRARLFIQDEKGNSAKEPDIIIFNDHELFNEETSVSLVNFMDVLFYNIDILAEAGFDRPPRTRGEYQNYSKSVNEKDFYCDDLSEPENNKPANIKLEEFSQGKAAMIVASTREISLFREKMGDEVFNLTAIPTATDGTTGRYDINITGIYAEVNDKSAYQEAAGIFIDFLAEHRTTFCEQFKAVPGIVSDVIPGDYVNGDPFYSKAWDIFEFNKSEGLQDAIQID